MKTNYFKAADIYAVAKAKADQAAAELEAARLAVIAEAAGAKRIDGEVYAVEITTYETSRLDTKAAREYLTPRQIELCTKTSDATRITIKPANTAAIAEPAPKPAKTARKAKAAPSNVVALDQSKTFREQFQNRMMAAR